MLDGEKAGVYGGERYSMACATHNNVPPDCPMTNWCVETDFCIISRQGDTCISVNICKVSDDFKCLVSDNCIISRPCLNTDVCAEPAG